MLVLTRKLGEKIIVMSEGGKEIIIEYVELRGNCVRIGITAPKDIDIWREELYYKGLEDRRNRDDPPEEPTDARP